MAKSKQTPKSKATELNTDLSGVSSGVNPVSSSGNTASKPTPKRQAKSKEETKTGRISRTGQQPEPQQSTPPPTYTPQPGVLNPDLPPPIKQLDPEKYDTNGFDPNRPVGPGNPHRKVRFAKGKSGNPKGYPKGRPNMTTLLRHWLDQKEWIINPMTGEAIKISVADTVLLALITQARKGNVQAINAIQDRLEGKPVQSTKLLNAHDKLLEISVGFGSPTVVNNQPATDAEKIE